MIDCIIVLIATFICGAVLGPITVPLMRKLKVGQTERRNAVEAHIAKDGTPTMGGFIFLIPMVLISVIFGIIKGNVDLFVLAGVALVYGAVGFADDYIKVVKHNKDGFIWYQKLAVLVVVSAAFAVYETYWGSDAVGQVMFTIFGKTTSINFGWLYIPFAVFVMVAMSNAVNITDGLDGLCAGSSVITFGFIAVASLFFAKDYAVLDVCFMFIGGLLSFLLVNYHPAKIFMGDTGSLAIGGVMGACVLMLRHPFMIVGAGLLYVVEVGSVILQVSYFKLTNGKRILKCAPLHHHFEKCGLKEIVVAYSFWAFTLLCSIVTFFVMKGF